MGSHPATWFNQSSEWCRQVRTLVSNPSGCNLEIFSVNLDVNQKSLTVSLVFMRFADLRSTNFMTHSSLEFQVLYLGNFDVFAMNGSNAVSTAMDTLFRMQNSHLRPIIVSFRVSPDGVTLTDLHCRQFLRRHFGADSFLFIGIDPYGRT